IDARFYGPKQKGLGRYVQKLIENLERIDENNQYIIFLRKENWSEYQPQNPNFQKVLADCHWYTLKEQILMPFKIRQAKIDLMHFPHFNVPLFYSGRFIITIHDLILKRFPTRRKTFFGPIRYWLKALGYQMVISSAIKRARKIIAVSNFTKQDILKYFKVEPDKIEVIYEGVPLDSGLTLRVATFREAKGRARKVEPEKCQPYLLYVGNAYPHKNLERLILAFEKLSQEKKDLQLVLVGESDYFYQQLQKQFSHLQNLIFADFVTDQELARLYQNASLYVFPSLCEGFGLPPLEAMVHNLPVVAARSSCLPEVLGQAAVYFNPEDIEDIRQKIKRVLTNKQLQGELISAGREKIKEYDWQKMAQETLKRYLADF
ncbi:MAG: glycosyltransferase family 1 protein, partial [Patescibacteria group bacterium]